MPQERTIKITLDGITKTDSIDGLMTAELRLTTYATTFTDMPKEVISSAKVVWPHKSGYSHAIGFGRRGDFSKTLFRLRGARRTQAIIDKQHAEIFTPEKTAELVAEARAYYSKPSE